jgi:DNA-binding transcriptional LysR family regulator
MDIDQARTFLAVTASDSFLEAARQLHLTQSTVSARIQRLEQDLMRRLVEGSLDLGLMYTPSHSPGLVVEHLFDETLVLVSTRVDDAGHSDDYVYVVEWGPGFHSRHTQSYPELEGPSQVANIGWLGIRLILANGGSCFLPARMAASFVAAGRLHRVVGSPEYIHPAYMVYWREGGSPVLEQALEGLRELAAQERRRESSS